MSWRTAGKLVTSVNCSIWGAGRGQRVEVQLERGAAVQVPGPRDSGCSSPIQPSSTAPACTSAARPGCRNGRVAAGAANSSSTRAAAPTRLDQALGRVEVAGHGLPAPGARRRLGDQRGQVVALVGGQGAGRAALGRGQVAARAGRRAGTRTAPARPRSARRVVARGVQQPRQQQRAHHALVLAQRVGQGQRRHVAQPQRLQRGGRGEAPGHDLVQAAVAQGVLQPAAQPLARRQAADGAAPCRQRDGQLVQAVDAGHLLDQVGLALHVGVAPVGHGHVQHAVAALGRRSPATPAGPPPRPRRSPCPAACAPAPCAAPPRAAPAARGRRRSGPAPAARRTGPPSAAPSAAGRPARSRDAAASRTGSRPRSAGSAPSRCAGRWWARTWRPPSARAWWSPRPRRSGRP